MEQTWYNTHAWPSFIKCPVSITRRRYHSTPVWSNLDIIQPRYYPISMNIMVVVKISSRKQLPKGTQLSAPFSAYWVLYILRRLAAGFCDFRLSGIVLPWCSRQRPSCDLEPTQSLHVDAIGSITNELDVHKKLIWSNFPQTIFWDTIKYFFPIPIIAKVCLN